MSGVSRGFFVCHCVAFSYAFARARTLPSEKRGPAIISPIGNPVFEKPAGIEMAGSPKMLNGVQFEIVSGSRGTNPAYRNRCLTRPLLDDFLMLCPRMTGQRVRTFCGSDPRRWRRHAPGPRVGVVWPVG